MVLVYTCIKISVCNVDKCVVAGVARFYKDIELMIGYQPCLWWKLLWCYITPTLIVVSALSVCFTFPWI